LAFTPKGNALWFVRTKGSLDTFGPWTERAKHFSSIEEKVFCLAWFSKENQRFWA
jgi:hypothetical protein